MFLFLGISVLCLAFFEFLFSLFRILGISVLCVSVSWNFCSLDFRFHGILVLFL